MLASELRNLGLMAGMSKGSLLWCTRNLL